MKEDQIEKEILVPNSNMDSSNQGIKGKSLVNNPLPALDFVKIENEIIRATEDIKKLLNKLSWHF